MTAARGAAADLVTRLPAVADAFYPADPGSLRALVGSLFVGAEHRYPPPVSAIDPIGILVPHAGLQYSGLVAAAGWRLLDGLEPATVVILGTNHGAGWLDGIGAWDRGAWRTPLGDVPIDEDLATEIVSLGRPFCVDRDAHLAEHSIEVQLPLLQTVGSGPRIVPLSVSTGVGRASIDAGARLGSLLAARREPGRRVVLAISTDMAHYPPEDLAERVTTELEEPILAIDAAALAARERALRQEGLPGLACGMCGIEPTVVGLAALRAAGATRAFRLAASTSADAGGPPDRTVGYFAAAFGVG